MGNSVIFAGDSQTFTVASCRFYLDEMDPCPGLMPTFVRYNGMAEWAYNYKYGEQFLGVRHGENFTRDAKARYLELYGERLPDYYVTSLDSHASGQIRSQKELLRLYGQENTLRIAACQGKIASIQETLAIHQEIKSYLVEYSRSMTKGTPMPDNTVPEKYGFFLRDGKICFYKRKTILWLDAYRYECGLDKKIKAGKARISVIGEKVKRLETKQFKIPRRATFGGRAEYKKKDTLSLTGPELRAWHQARDTARRCRINFNGRHTSKYGNFQCRYDVQAGRVDITLLDGSVLTLNHVSFPYRGDELKGYIQDREGSVGYVLELRTDGHGREYLVLKATITRENRHVNSYLGTGCIAFDTNVDCLAWCDLDGTGNRIRTGAIPFHLDGLNTDQSTQGLARAIGQLISIAREARKPLAMEDLDFFRKKAAMAYRDKNMNRSLSAFAYKKITELVKAACYRNGIGLYIVPPAYTSLTAKLKYMRPLGCTVHEAAAFVIGRRAMGLNERVPGYLRRVAKNTGRGDFWKVWKPVQANAPALPWRLFRKKIPTVYRWADIKTALTG